MKRILVPTDFSNNAYNALLYAARLFSKEEVIIYILHTFEESFSRSTSRVDIGKSEAVYDKLHQEAQTKLEEAKHGIIRDTEGRNCTFEVQDSTLPIHKMINAFVKKEGIDIVIMGTKGASGLREIMLGSQAVKVVKKIMDCPLLLVPVDSDFSSPKNMCFATDFEKSLEEQQLALFRDIVVSTDSTVHIAHIYDQEELDVVVESNYKNLKNDLGDLAYNTHWISNKGSKAKAIEEFVSVNSIDFLAMVYKKHSFVNRVFREPIIKNIGFHLKVPFLILQE